MRRVCAIAVWLLLAPLVLAEEPTFREVHVSRVQFTWHYPPEVFPGDPIAPPREETREWTYVGDLDEAKLAAFLKSRPTAATPPFVSSQLVLVAARILKPPAATTPLAEVLAKTREGGGITSAPWSTEIRDRERSVVGSFAIDLAAARVDVKVRIVCVQGWEVTK